MPARPTRTLRVLFIGHSHPRCVRDAAAEDAAALAARDLQIDTLLLRPAQPGDPVRPDREGELLPPEQQAEVPAAQAPDPTHANPWYGRQLIAQVLQRLPRAAALQVAA